MALFKNCILASDVDGTLVDSGYISPRNIKAINFFRENGGIFVLSTGRSAPAVDQVFALMDKSLVGPSVVLNGGMIFDFENGKPLMAKTLTNRSKEDALYIKENFPEIGIEIHSESQIYVMNKTDETEFHEDYELLGREYVDYDEVKEKPWNKVLYTCNDDETRERIFEALTSYDPENSLFVRTGVKVDGITHPYIEQAPLGTTKANALIELCKMLKIANGGFFAIGDYYNDVEMLKVADISATPAEAPEDIKEIANFVGGSCHNGAVADFIEFLTSMEEKTWTNTRKEN